MRKVIGIDFGASNLKGGIVSEEGTLLIKHPGLKTQGKRPGAEIAEDIVGIARYLLERDPAVEAVAIGSPGIILPDGAYGFPPVNCPNWGTANLKAMVESRLHKPCFVNNDAQVFGAGERRWGAGRDARCMLMLTLGTGIGGGLSYCGQDFQGARNTIEIGHICVDFSSTAALCGCGNRGCAEAYASDTGISSQAREAVRRGLLPDPPGEIEAKWIYDLAKAGHPVAAGMIDRAHGALSALIAGLANGLSIDVCILGGGITGAGDFLFDDVRARVKARLVPTADVDIRPATLGTDFGTLGAAAFGFDILDARSTT